MPKALLCTVQTPAVLPRSCKRHLAPKLSKLHDRLHLAAAPGKGVQRQISRTQGKHAYLVRQALGMFPCLRTAARQLVCLQASLSPRLAPLSADWLRTCNSRCPPGQHHHHSPEQQKILVEEQHVQDRAGGRTGGKQAFQTAQMAGAAPMMLAEQSAPAMTWLTNTPRWQRSESGRPVGERTPETVAAYCHYKAT